MNPSSEGSEGNVTFVPSGEGPVCEVLADRVQFKVVGASTAGAWSMFEISAGPGSAVPAHRHDWEETYWVLEGNLEFQIGDRIQPLSPGACIRVGPRTPHGLRNASSVVARYILMATPAGTEAFFLALDQAARKPGFGMDVVLEIAAKHGISLEPPMHPA